MKNRFKKTIIFLLMATLVFSSLAFFTACSKKDDVNTLRIGRQPGVLKTMIQQVAENQGYYKEEGVNVEFVDIASSTAAITSLASNKKEIDVWTRGILPALNFIDKGSDLVVFGGIAAEGGAILVRTEDIEKYQNFKEFENKTIATTLLSTAWEASRIALIDMGIDVSTIKEFTVTDDINAVLAVQKGEADIAFTPLENGKNAENDKVKIVHYTGELSPLYVCCRQTTNSKVIETKKEALINYTKANIRAYKYFNDPANRDELVNQFVDYTKQPKEFVEWFLYDARHKLLPDPNVNGVERLYNELVKRDRYEGKIDIKQHVDKDIYKLALDDILQRYPNVLDYKDLESIYADYNIVK